MGLVDNLQKVIFGNKAVVSAKDDASSKKPGVKEPKKKKGLLGKKKNEAEVSLEKTEDKANVEGKKKEDIDDSIDIDLEEGIFTETEAVNKFAQGLVGVQDLIAPAAIEVDFSHLKMNEKFYRTLYVLTYPNMLPTSWMAGVINLPHNLAVSTFYYPIDSRLVMQKLKRKISEFQATLNMTIDEGKIPDPGVKIALDDAQKLQELLAKNEEKYFHYALYITMQADSLKELNDIHTEVESTLGTLGIVAKPASLEMEQGLQSCIPTGMDNLYKTRNMSTDAISATFPFVTSSLTMDSGVLYGLNRHNNSLVVFDRFSMENANSVVFATSGAGKSYMVKLEIYRSMMLGTKVVVIDPEREYKALCDTVGGSYISFSQTGGDKINPFDLSGVYEEGENELADKRLFLLGLLRLMLGGLSPEEKAILDRAIGLTYQEKGIVDDPATQSRTAPLMEDLYKILKGMAEEEAHDIATRLEMFIKGAAAGVFDRPTTVDLNNSFTVFSLQELSDELRPIAMYMMLDYIWTRIRKDKVKRILVVDEAWYMMQHEDSARFLYWFAKRARKYFLGLTTITQDVEDFLESKYGKAIVTNSSIKILLKQNTAAIDRIQSVFKLSDGERLILLNSAVGEGLFFAGQSHVMLQVVSSEHEHSIVSTDPKEATRKKLLTKLSKDASQTSDASKKLQDESHLVDVEGGKVESKFETPLECQQISQTTGDEVEKEEPAVLETPEDIQVEPTVEDFVKTEEVFPAKADAVMSVSEAPSIDKDLGAAQEEASVLETVVDQPIVEEIPEAKPAQEYVVAPINESVPVQSITPIQPTTVPAASPIIEEVLPVVEESKTADAVDDLISPATFVTPEVNDAIEKSAQKPDFGFGQQVQNQAPVSVPIQVAAPTQNATVNSDQDLPQDEPISILE